MQGRGAPLWAGTPGIATSLGEEDGRDWRDDSAWAVARIFLRTEGGGPSDQARRLSLPSCSRGIGRTWDSYGVVRNDELLAARLLFLSGGQAAGDGEERVAPVGEEHQPESDSVQSSTRVRSDRPRPLPAPHQTGQILCFDAPFLAPHLIKQRKSDRLGSRPPGSPPGPAWAFLVLSSPSFFLHPPSSLCHPPPLNNANNKTNANAGLTQVPCKTLHAFWARGRSPRRRLKGTRTT